MISNYQHWTPFEFENDLSAMDLKAIATTQYATGILRVIPFFAFFLALKVDNTGGGAAGEVKITLEVYGEKDESTPIDSEDILTTIATTADTTELLLFGGGVFGASKGVGSLSANIDVYKVLHKIQLIVEVVTASDAATSCVGTLNLLADG